MKPATHSRTSDLPDDGQQGFTLIETLVAMLVLTVGVMGMGATFLAGMQVAAGAPNELVATQKAAEAVESVFSARDSHTLTWSQLKNVKDGGIFVDAATKVSVAGADGIVNTSDDGALEKAVLPGRDGLIGTGDDTVLALNGFTRQITVTTLSSSLRQITVTIKYPSRSRLQTYELTALISQYA
jgi:prepilin-type N-terminal cleavage/methylation domain-containing protein